MVVFILLLNSSFQTTSLSPRKEAVQPFVLRTLECNATEKAKCTTLMSFPPMYEGQVIKLEFVLSGVITTLFQLVLYHLNNKTGQMSAVQCITFMCLSALCISLNFSLFVVTGHQTL